MRKFLFTFFLLFFASVPAAIFSAPIDINLGTGSQEKPGSPLLLDRGGAANITGPLEIVAGKSGYDASAAVGPAQVIANLVRYSLEFIGVIFVVLMLYAGFLWMTASGNEEKIETAKKLLLNGSIGLGIVLLAVSIWIFVVENLYLATGGQTVEQAASPSFAGNCCPWDEVACRETGDCSGITDPDTKNRCEACVEGLKIR